MGELLVSIALFAYTLFQVVAGTNYRLNLDVTASAGCCNAGTAYRCTNLEIHVPLPHTCVNPPHNPTCQRWLDPASGGFAANCQEIVQ